MHNRCMMQLTITNCLNILRCFGDNAFFSSSRDSNTMVDQNKLSLYLEQLRDELIAETLWLEEELDENKYNSTAPFCCDTMAFHEWLQFVFLPKMQYMIDNNLELPSSLAIAPMGEVEYRAELKERENLIKILNEIDSLFV